MDADAIFIQGFGTTKTSDEKIRYSFRFHP